MLQLPCLTALRAVLGNEAGSGNLSQLLELNPKRLRWLEFMRWYTTEGETSQRMSKMYKGSPLSIQQNIDHPMYIRKLSEATELLKRIRDNYLAVTQVKK